MWKWILILIIVVIVLGYLQSKKAKREEEKHKDEIGACGGGCVGCANKDLCSVKQNEEKK
ncbi:hypothetical protein SDC9_82574 [bioreactor metagenome]|uniref:FeoB-associated Cys-rich membrane protein n=1 Tax=bioreactor metagenome TaxID=1076179 RepID=A0A644Z509_9ZZZZ|nr:hypothetical protein [Candidatus Metalachnospira sp.]